LVERLPLSNTVDNSVAVCGAESLFVHSTDEPFVIRTVSGTKAKPWIATVAAGVDGVGATLALFDEQLNINDTPAKAISDK